MIPWLTRAISERFKDEVLYNKTLYKSNLLLPLFTRIDTVLSEQNASSLFVNPNQYAVPVRFSERDP